MKKHTLLYVLCSAALLASCNVNVDSSSEYYSEGDDDSSNVDASSSDDSGESEVTALKGEGTKASPYLIGTAAELKFFNANPVMSAYYKLTADIAYDGEWSTIGKGTTSSDIFSGVFLGDGHKITGLTISEFSKNQKVYGFFGYASDAYFKDLTLEMDISGNVVGKDSDYVYGGLVAYGENTSINNCHVNFEKFVLESVQNGESSLTVGGIAGLLDISSETNMLYVSLSNNSVTGNIRLDLGDSNGVTSYAGGFAGMVSTGLYEGIYSLNNLSYKGSLEGGTLVGGIAAYLSNYSTITNSYVSGDHITSSVNDGCYVGGLAGYAGYETFAYGNYINLVKVSAPESTSNYYQSYASETIGYGVSDVYEEDSDVQGTGYYKNYYADGVVVTGDNTETHAEKGEFTADLAAEMGFSSKVWNLTDKTLLNAKDVSYTVNATINHNGVNLADKVTTVNAGTYDVNYARLSAYEAPKWEGYSYYGLSYDAAGTTKMRWYMPINSDTTLYCSYASVANLVGDYAYTCLYYGEPIGEGGYWKFDNDYFYWLYNDGSSAKYSYSFDGSYIFIGDFLGEEELASQVGGYEDEIFRLQEDGSIQAYDVNSDDAVYSAKKDGSTKTIPDYSDASFLGEWKSLTSSLTLYASGNVLGNKSTSTVKYAGGFMASGNKLHIYVPSGICPAGDYNYDEANGLLIGDTNIYSRSTVDGVVSNKDGTHRVISTNGHLYLIENNAVSATTVSGSIEEGGTLIIGTKEYIVKDGIFTEVTPANDNAVIAATYDATYTVMSNNVKATLTLTEDGKATLVNSENVTLMSFDFIYTASDNKIVVSNFIVYEDRDGYFEGITLTYDKTTKKLSGSGMYNYDSISNGYTLTASIHTDEPETDSVVGTYTGQYVVNGNKPKCYVVLSDTGSGKIYRSSDNTEVMDFEYTYADGKISVTKFNEKPDEYVFHGISLTYNKETKTLTGSGTWGDGYDDYDYTLTATYSGPVETTPSTEDVITKAVVAGEYSGKWGLKTPQSDCTLSLTAEGKGTFKNDNGGITMTFDWDADSTTGVLSISNFYEATGCYEDLKLTYKDGKITGTVYENEDCMANFTITLSK